MPNQPDRNVSKPLNEARIRARAKRAALMAARSDAVLRPVQARKGTPHTLESILSANTVHRRRARPV